MQTTTRASIKSIKLSSAERAILDSYVSLLDGFAGYFGEGYEFVLHSLENLDRSVIKIVNGFHTGREVGAPVTDLALNMLAQIESQNGPTHITYGSQTKRGEPLHSSTIAIKGEKGRIIGLLCMNFHLNTPLRQVFMNMFQAVSGAAAPVQENFAMNVGESVSEAVAAAKLSAEREGDLSTLLRNKRIITILFEQGVFKLKGSVPRVAQILGISRNTVYLHLRALQEK